MMAHINAAMLAATRKLIGQHLAGNRYRFECGPTMPTTVHDTGVPCDPTMHPYVSDFLSEAAGPPHGVKSLREALGEILEQIAIARSAENPARSVRNFLSVICRQPFAQFLGQHQAATKAQEASVRRKLAVHGLALRKKRIRNPLREGFRTYDVVETASKGILIDAPRGFSAIEEWAQGLNQPEQPAQRDARNQE